MKYLPWAFIGLLALSFYLHYQLLQIGATLSTKRGYHFSSLLSLEPNTFVRLFILLVCAGVFVWFVNLVRVQGGKIGALDLFVAAAAAASCVLVVAPEFRAPRRGLLIKAMTTGILPSYYVDKEEYPDLLEVPSVRTFVIAEMASYERLLAYAALRLDGLTNDAILEQHPGVIARMVQVEGNATLDDEDKRYLAMLKRHRVKPEGTFLYGCLPYPWAKEKLRGLVAKGVSFPLDIYFEHPGLVSREDAWKLMELLVSDMKKNGRGADVAGAYLKNVRALHGFLSGKVPQGKLGLSVAVREEGGGAAESLAGWQEGFFGHLADMLRLCGYEAQEGGDVRAAVKILYETRPGTVWREETRYVKKQITVQEVRYRRGGTEFESVKKWVEEREQHQVSHKATLKRFPRAEIAFEASGRKLELVPPRWLSSDEKGEGLTVDVLAPGEYRVDFSNHPDYLASPWSWKLFE